MIKMDFMRAYLVGILFGLGCTFALQHRHEYCEQRGKLFEDNCYILYLDGRKTWPEAQNTCRERKMDLVSIHNERENNFIWNMIKKEDRRIWIGLKRQPEGTLNGFSWSDGSISNFSNWRNGEPNNRMGNEDCAEMHFENGKWNDLFCTFNLVEEQQNMLGFICITVPSGPTRSDLTGPPYSSHKEVVRLSCCTDGAYPGIDYQWKGVICSSTTDTAQCSTCKMTSDKELEGKLVTCTAINTRDPSKRTTATYRIAITYGPCNVSISQPLIKQLRPKQIVSLYCFAHDALPGVKYTWSGIACVQHELPIEGSTCSFTASVSDDGKTVACTAVNLIDTNLSMTATYEIHVTDDVQTNYLPIIIGSTVGFIVLIVAIISVVLWKRKHQGLDNNTTDVPETGDQGVGERDVHCSEMKTENNFYDETEQSDRVLARYIAHYAKTNTDKGIYKARNLMVQDDIYTDAISAAVCPLNAGVDEMESENISNTDYEEILALAMIEDGTDHSPNVQTDISVSTSEHQEESLIRELQDKRSNKEPTPQDIEVLCA